jgi:hypothetical protein
MLDHTLRFRIRRLTEVRPEAVVGGEAHIVGVRHDHVGHHAGFEAAHSVGQHHRRHAAQLLEALGQQLQGGLAALVGGEAHETVTAPGQHGAEHLQAVDGAPVDGQVLARHGYPWPEAAPPPAPLGLGQRDRPTEVAGRAAIASCLGLRQQALGRDLAVGVAHPLGDEVGDDVSVVSPSRPLRPRAHAALDHAADCLVSRAAQLGRGSVAAQLAIGVQDVQSFPR